MDYEKAYKEALERAKEFQKSKEGLCVLTAESIFPELAESEDERIIEQLLYIVKDYQGYAPKSGLGFKECLAWLEKQKINTEGDFGRGYDCGYQAGYAVAKSEMKPKVATATFDSEKQKEQKSDSLIYDKDLDKAAREFYLSGGADSPVDSTGLVPIVRMAEFGASWMKERMEKEQKPAEYLDKDKVYAIMTKLTNLSYSQLIPINSDEFKKLHEITSEVRDLLDYPIEQKPSWSEEDERMLKNVLFVLESYVSHSECASSPSLITTYPTYYKEIDWLKSLPMKCPIKSDSWKPSEEQMSMLLAVIRDPNNAGSESCFLALQSLYEDLKKLM